MKPKAQGALEYLLLIGGAVVVGSIVIVLLLGSASSGKTSAMSRLDLIEQKKAEAGANLSGLILNGFFEQGSGTGATDWPSDTTCGDLCFYRRNDPGYSIPGAGYSWYMFSPAGSGWDNTMQQRVSGINQPSKTFNLEFKYLCRTATSPNGLGWIMRFRDHARPCCEDVYSTSGIATKSDGSTETKSMTNFLCAANESGTFRVTLTTLANAGSDYYWDLWAYSGHSSNQELIVDNFKVS
ncbi:MAG: class III signal peptide-containing protein [Candidatus Diapherotrites archaeon]|uniref:Class III signal peptide-containing protein n=1 Tax=Candidatus Iainarchaeum sp. TaxID=3101447 RepID=A0A8T3YKH1_9ARCH|nr:class III signal peptide-containing protein [Candidatus Diapherotrites archaeon]